MMTLHAYLGLCLLKSEVLGAKKKTNTQAFSKMVHPLIMVDSHEDNKMYSCMHTF